ncbi:hypothetical protein RND81_09G254600 [Saponaria officinalis]|uniref:Homeobox domain-containing protein n=2 Tax=Saponaria officinalis TaxID=3572 RepID=A0AAW1IS77_SAPOF
MEESMGLRFEEIKEIPEKNKGRQYKSREQLQGLEDFYNENKYPTESLRAEIASKLNLTEKQVTGWFCHRRLKEKRLLEESQAPRKQDLSSGVIQDRGSGPKQDSCSSTKQAEYKRADLKEVESRIYCHENLPTAELNYHQRSVGGGTEVDDTSSESNSAPQESFHPQNRSSNMAVETTEYRGLNGFSQHRTGRVGPSGYLKIKGQTENAAITAVKRQLGRHYREDGPSLGIEFDPLPPEAFESPIENTNDYAYEVPEPIGFVPQDASGFQKHHGISTVWNEKLYEAPDDTYLHKSDPNKSSFRQPKQKPHFPNHSHGFPDQNSSFGLDSYSPREKSDYNNSRNFSIQRNQDLPGMRSDSQFDYSPHSAGKNTSNQMITFSPSYDNVNSKVVRQREQFSFKPDALVVRHNDLVCKEDRPPSNRKTKVNKRGREDILEDAYPIRKLPQDAALWTKPVKGPTEMPSSFSEDETAETSSSMD